MSEVQKRYNILAPIYDLLDIIPERLFYSGWRRQQWENCPAVRILEIGIGTGKNIPYYPSGANITGIDISPHMLKRARMRAISRQDVSVELLVMDVASMLFTSDTFDAVIGSFVLTVLEDPSGALQEIKRVCKPGGTLLLLEFVHGTSRPIALIQDLAVLITRTIYKAYINRDVITLIKNAGFQNITTEDVGDGIVKIIRAIAA